MQKNDQNLLQKWWFCHTATYRALRGDFGYDNRWTTQAIGKIVNKFKETGVITNIEWSVQAIAKIVKKSFKEV